MSHIRPFAGFSSQPPVGKPMTAWEQISHLVGHTLCTLAIKRMPTSLLTSQIYSVVTPPYFQSISLFYLQLKYSQLSIPNSRLCHLMAIKCPQGIKKAIIKTWFSSTSVNHFIEVLKSITSESSMRTCVLGSSN